MNDTLVDRVNAQLGGNAAGVLGSLLGEPASKTGAALGAAVPGVLAALVGLAARGGPDADRLLAAIAAQDQRSIDALPETLRSGRPQALVDQGAELLSGLLGVSTLTGLAGAIGRFAGIGRGSARTLLGLLTPVALVELARGGDADGAPADDPLAVLMAQKAKIEEALPAGFAGALGTAELAGGRPSGPAPIVAPLSRPAAEPAPTAAAAPTPPAAQWPKATPSEAVAPPVSRRRVWLRWLLTLLVILGLVWLGAHLLPPPRDETAPTGDVPAAPSGAPAAPADQ